MFDTIMNFITRIILIGLILVYVLSLPFIFIDNIINKGSKRKTTKSKSYRRTVQRSNKAKQYNKVQNKPSRLPGVHEDYDEIAKQELIKKGVYDESSFEEEDLEEDDYHYEDEE